ncbi:MAG: hypothetical protein AB4372_11360 [Xenococcus sp. (in: cyanobacteria)]
MLNFAIIKRLAQGKLVTTSLLSASFVGLFATTSIAGDPTGTITNENFSIDEGVGNEIVLDRVVTVNLDNLATTITNTVTGAPTKVDVLFLADNTGSMSEEIANVQTNAQDLLDDLRAAYTDTTDIQFGVARYYGAPKEYNMECGYGNCWYNGGPSVPGDKKVIGTTTVQATYTTTYTYEYWTYWFGYWYNYSYVTLDEDGNTVDSGDVWKWSYNGESYTESDTEYLTENVYSDVPVEMDSYELQVPIGGTDAEVIQAIGTTSSSDNAYSWNAQGGKDWAEANFFALHQAATSGAATNLGWQTGYDTNWRDDSMKIIVWFGDAPSHTSDTTETETIAALSNNNIYVVAVNVGSGSQTINKNNQATNITTATSGQYASSAASNVANTMETLIGTAVEGYTETTTTTTYPTIDINFRTSNATPLPEGLTVTYICTDPHPDGCDNVNHQESRTFQMIVEGNKADTYNFETEVFDVETDHEVVDADNTIHLHNID